MVLKTTGKKQHLRYPLAPLSCSFSVNKWNFENVTIHVRPHRSLFGKGDLGTKNFDLCLLLYWAYLPFLSAYVIVGLIKA